MRNQYVLEVKEDPGTGDLYFEFPDTLMDHMGWKAGDVLLWEENGNGSWTLSVDSNQKDLQGFDASV